MRCSSSASPEAARLERHGSLATTTADNADAYYLFRGTVRHQGSRWTPGAPPWALANRFVALLEIHQPQDSAKLSIVFLGTPEAANQPAPGADTTGSTPSTSSTPSAASPGTSPVSPLTPLSPAL